MTKSRDEVTRAIETTMNWNDERTLDEVEAGIVSPERSGGMKLEGELTFRDGPPTGSVLNLVSTDQARPGSRLWLVLARARATSV